ncbi:MAG: hypothetical protein ICV65_14280 [Flavisolibacter sp.]|nr:hypothetical protein [Flavisolibacter sp.]MBD0352314.1 hypothetical protein [Flavisolibacter sp.]
MVKSIRAQPPECTFKPPFILIHFGTGNVKDINGSAPPNYERVFSSCPTDGYYAYTSSVPGCFRDDWFTLTEDHTPNDKDGNMMLVNAYPGGGVFFTTTIRGFAGNTTYELAAWLMNVCRIGGSCTPLPPNITMRLTTPAGKKVAEFQTGQLPQREAPRWQRYWALFTTPPNEPVLVLTMLDNTIGYCGNDFALDDITFRECVKPEAPVTVAPKPLSPPVVKKQPPTTKPATMPSIKKEPVKRDTVTTSARVNTIIKNEKEPSVNTVPVVQQKTAVAIPLILKERANPVIKRIEAEAGEIKINLYDNGEIDGDTVSIYHNNELIVANAGLSQKPITIRLTLDRTQPHHELVMVANNLGSIPPNTSLMIVTIKDKRYEVFISSTEQKNAKVVIDLKE